MANSVSSGVDYKMASAGVLRNLCTIRNADIRGIEIGNVQGETTHGFNPNPFQQFSCGCGIQNVFWISNVDIGISVRGCQKFSGLSNHFDSSQSFPGGHILTTRQSVWFQYDNGFGISDALDEFFHKV